MIVKCDKCQTRFKIPDEKVTEKGVKVRCTKCQHTFRVARAPEGATQPMGVLPSPPPSVDPDPFASFGRATGAGPAHSTAVLGEHHDLPQEVFSSPTRVGPIPTAPVSVPAAPAAPAFDPSDPFAGIDMGGQSASRPPAASRPPTDFEQTNPLTPAYQLPPDAFSAPQPPAPAPPSALLGGLPDPTEPAGSPFGRGTGIAATTATDLLGALPPPDEDPFGQGDLDGGGGAFAGGLSDEPDRALFDMPASRPAAPSPEDTPTAIARLSPPSRPPAPRLDGSPGKPHGRPDDVGMAESSGPGAFGRAAGMVVNIAVASALLVALVSVGTIYLNEGKLDPSSVSLEPLKALFAAPSELRAVDVSNGLYDTRSGRQLFYVRGEVENRGAGPARVTVRVEIVDGALSVGSAQSPLGFAPSPEELFAVSSPAELASLKAKAATDGGELPPGARRPFLLAFYDYPPDLSQYRLKVTVVPAGSDPTAARQAER